MIDFVVKCSQKKCSGDARNIPERGQFTQRLRRSEPTWLRITYNKNEKPFRSALGAEPRRALTALCVRSVRKNNAQILGDTNLNSKGRDSALGVARRAGSASSSVEIAMLGNTNGKRSSSWNGPQKDCVLGVGNLRAGTIRLSVDTAKQSTTNTRESDVRNILRRASAQTAGSVRPERIGTSAHNAPYVHEIGTRRLSLPRLRSTATSAYAAAKTIFTFLTLTTYSMTGQRKGVKLEAAPPSFGRHIKSLFRHGINYFALTAMARRNFMGAVHTNGMTPISGPMPL
jgi:hypothetical protein